MVEHGDLGIPEENDMPELPGQGEEEDQILTVKSALRGWLLDGNIVEELVAVKEENEEGEMTTKTILAGGRQAVQAFLLFYPGFAGFAYYGKNKTPPTSRGNLLSRAIGVVNDCRNRVHSACQENPEICRGPQVDQGRGRE